MELFLKRRQICLNIKMIILLLMILGIISKKEERRKALYPIKCLYQAKTKGWN